MDSDADCLTDNPYLMLTCAWDHDYDELVQDVRRRLLDLATRTPEAYTVVPMQGSGTFGIEALLGSIVPPDGRLLVLSNGAYGRRITKMARVLKLDAVEMDVGDLEPVGADNVAARLRQDRYITHVAVVHCETTTGMLNPLDQIAAAVKKERCTLLVDAMSSFGGIPLDVHELGIDALVSSSNTCIEGVPGFSFVIIRKEVLQRSIGQARSYALDLYDQWTTMEEQSGKWRFTSPTHAVHAFRQALLELEAEGGVPARWARFSHNQSVLVEGMARIGLRAILPRAYQSPIITSFHYPATPLFDFSKFYRRLRRFGYVIYPGKTTELLSFRIATIGDVHPEDMRRLVQTIEANRFWEPRNGSWPRLERSSA